MACGGFFSGSAGQTFKLKITQDNGERMTGSLTEFDRQTTAIAPGTTFTRSQLRAGISIALKAGWSYHLEIIKTPAAGNVQLQIGKPAGGTRTDNCSGQILGPWIIRAV